MARKGVLVIGSANMDLVVKARRFPRPGETVFGGGFGMFPGGKGANQAVACAKLGGDVRFIGRMGNDVFRDRLVENMTREGVRMRHLSIDRRAPTGVGLIMVDGTGQNEIVVVSGSNMTLRPRDVEQHRSAFIGAGIVLLQLEIPLATILRTVHLARRRGVTVILNPAPARKLPKSLLRSIDYLTPNETELGILAGRPVSSVRTAESAARQLLDEGVRNILVTLGARGCLLVNGTMTRLFPARKVRAVDTTAAGDAFNGALAFSLASGQDLLQAIPFANCVAAYAVTRLGAQSSMPTLKDLRTFMD